LTITQAKIDDINDYIEVSLEPPLRLELAHEVAVAILASLTGRVHIYEQEITRQG